METKEIELKAEILGVRSLKIRKVKEIWDVVKFGDKEFLMPKDVKDYFTSKMYENSHFYLYFDGDNVITDNEYHIPFGTHRKAKEHRFIIANENTELWKPEGFTLIAKENGLALYTVNHDDNILYRNGNKYTIVFRCGNKSRSFYKQKVIFETEKPLNEETFNLIKRLHDNTDKAKCVKIGDGEIGFFEVEILDYNDVNVYTTDNEHHLVALENAEIVRVFEDIDGYRIEKLIAIKGNKTYLGTEQVYYQSEGSYIKFNGANKYYISNYRFYDYIPDVIGVIRKDMYKSIVEIPSLDSDIIVRKWITKTEPEVIVAHPHTLNCNFLEPELMEERTFKVRNLVDKPAKLYY